MQTTHPPTANHSRCNDLQRATRLLSILIDRGHAKVTNLIQVQFDSYYPLANSLRSHGAAVDYVQDEKGAMVPLPMSPEVDREMFVVATADDVAPVADANVKPDHGAITATATQTTLAGLTTLSLQAKLSKEAAKQLGGSSSSSSSPSSSPSSGDGSPRYVQPPVEFRYQDFLPLLRKAESLGMVTLQERVQELLERGKRGLHKEEEKSLERLQRTKAKLRKRW